MAITIREAIPHDATALAQLITHLGYPTQAQDVSPRLERMPAEFYRTLIAESEDRVVGFVGLLTLPVYEHPKSIGWILALCVAPDYRHQGVGRALMTATENHYRHRCHRHPPPQRSPAR